MSFMLVCKSDSPQSFIREVDPRDIEIMKLEGKGRHDFARVGEKETKKVRSLAKTRRSEGRRRGNRPQHTCIHAVLSFFRRFCLPAPANHKIANASRNFRPHASRELFVEKHPAKCQIPVTLRTQDRLQGKHSLIMNYLNLINEGSHLQAIRKLSGNDLSCSCASHVTNA